MSVPLMLQLSFSSSVVNHSKRPLFCWELQSFLSSLPGPADILIMRDFERRATGWSSTATILLSSRNITRTMATIVVNFFWCWPSERMSASLSPASGMRYAFFFVATTSFHLQYNIQRGCLSLFSDVGMKVTRLQNFHLCEAFRVSIPHFHMRWA